MRQLIERLNTLHLAICKKEKKLLGNPCDKPLEVCMAIAPVPGVFEGNHPWGGRVISKEEAYGRYKHFLVDLNEVDIYAIVLNLCTSNLGV